MSMSYTIGSFNVMKMSYQSNDETNKNYKKLAEIIKREKFDVVALQEVFSPGAIKNLLIPRLNGNENWDYRWESPLSLSGISAEGYAFIWNKDKLNLINSADNPKIYNQYRIKGNRLSGSQKKLIGAQGLLRPPYVARFTPSGTLGGSNFEIRLISTHISFGRAKNAELFMTDPEMGKVAVRRQELATLSEQIYRMVSTKQYGDNMPSYTFLLGDYNLCLCGSESRMEEFIPIDESRTLRTVQREKTSLKQVKKDEVGQQEILEDYYAHDYDHFSYETALDEKLNLKVSRVDALST